MWGSTDKKNKDQIQKLHQDIQDKGKDESSNPINHEDCHAICDAPPSPLLDSKEPNYGKGGSRWDLVPLPTSSTKGGEKGMLKASGLE
jgi:hypothetical protein